MTFQEFVEITRPVIGGKGGAHTYVRTLFDAILTDEGRGILENYSMNTYKAYANGRTKITGIAKEMAQYIDTVEFANFIYETGESVQLGLCRRFETYLPGINVRNVGDEIADLFADIIREAAAQKRKSAPKDANGNAGKTPYDVISEKILTSGRAMADAWGKAIQAMADDMSGADTVEAEVVDGAESSGAAEKPAQPETKIQIIEKAIVVNQYGENCVHIDHVDTFKL